MFFIIFVCGISFVLLFYGDDARADTSSRRVLHAAGAVILLLLVFGPRWLPEFGIDPQAVVNGALFVAFAFVILMSFADQIRR